jgi:hypothetical protein
VTNLEKIASALKNYRGEILTTNEIQMIVSKANPEFAEASLLVNDHAHGNKSLYSPTGTKRWLLDRINSGSYRVL